MRKDAFTTVAPSPNSASSQICLNRLLETGRVKIEVTIMRVLKFYTKDLSI